MSVWLKRRMAPVQTTEDPPISVRDSAMTDPRPCPHVNVLSGASLGLLCHQGSGNVQLNVYCSCVKVFVHWIPCWEVDISACYF